MKKPWSITTTLRNPERIRELLVTLQEIDGDDWTLENQEKYQILLIKNRAYGYGSPQFYNGLPQEMVDLVDDITNVISFEQAQNIFNVKNYEDPAMRGRQSLNPLKKLGFAVIDDGKVKLTNLGKSLLQDDFDYGNTLFRSFLKWQIPNPDSRDYSDNGTYNIKPFIGTLQLIKAVNNKELERGNESKGISKEEFSLFVPTLVHYGSIDEYANQIIALRDELREKDKKEKRVIFSVFKKQFARIFLKETGDENVTVADVDSLINNLSDYGDNIIRYFRLTRYIHIRGGGYYIDLEPRRTVEINALLAHDNGHADTFESKESYLAYIADIGQPVLPWETKEKYLEIITEIINDVHSYENKLGRLITNIGSLQELDASEIKKHIEKLRNYRRELQEQENHQESQSVEKVQSYIDTLENIRDYEDRPILLEKLSALGLHALNDALKVKPNYPVGDDNEPTFTAPANTPDIECYYQNFNAICEVTMLTGRDQWYNEGQPVMRHLRDFETKNSDKPSYCLFIAPQLHRDTLNTFWMSVKYEYEGARQRIVPLSINNFTLILKTLVDVKRSGKRFTHQNISTLYEDIITLSQKHTDSSAWVGAIPSAISAWSEELIAQ